MWYVKHPFLAKNTTVSPSISAQEPPEDVDVAEETVEPKAKRRGAAKKAPSRHGDGANATTNGTGMENKTMKNAG